MVEIYRAEVPTGILYTPINQSSSGTIVIGVPGKSIVVISAWLIASASTTAEFQTSTGSTPISGPAACAANGGFVLPFNAGGWFETFDGDSLLLNLSPGVSVGGSVSYIIV